MPHTVSRAKNLAVRKKSTFTVYSIRGESDLRITMKLYNAMLIGVCFEAIKLTSEVTI